MFGVSNSLLAFSAAVAALVFGVFKLVRARLFFRNLDTWPFMEPQMVITDPDAAMQGASRGGGTAAMNIERANKSSLKALLLGGHGTTTDTFTFAAMLLSVHPEAMARLRREHDEVFAPGLDATVALIEEDPKRTNRLEYTNAVIKETLRFFPIGFTIPRGAAGHNVALVAGARVPRRGRHGRAVRAHVAHGRLALGRSQGLPPGALPRRGGGGDAPDLAMDELRVMLLLTARWFDFETVVEGTSERVMYMDLDKLVGDLAFQEIGMEARPRSSMRMRVKLREPASSQE
ncbi:conserved hypothetical protein [Verticillium alfalfae VaMs.102]|uniref:Cytochrome P450 n=1 Tax=Verticillium alfalfae (strain VaMs.102 / ATCC MYA-4576 / FGSC 10136) TaxID=526221 RepID=C9S5U7_VERA1|nr:conserved hypothetical protein [Verticillium alfalfae VaMs.102]EEY15086.1 conserved hypothetical protein [Verticillium alfalfae VaMs.102]